MKLISISRTVEKLDYKSNDQDYKTWSAMSEYFDNIFLVVQSPDHKNHKEVLGKIYVFWIADKGSLIVKRLHFMKEAYRLSKGLIKQYAIDVVNIGEPVISGIPAIKLKKKMHIPLVTQVQGQLMEIPRGTFFPLKSLYIRMITRYVCKKSDLVRTVSEDIRRSLINNRINPDKVVCIPSRCDVNKFNRKRFESERDFLRREIGYGKDDIVIEFTGRVVAYRDVESDLYALKEARKHNAQLKLLIVGDGDDVPRLKRIVQSEGLEKAVLFYGRVQHEDIPKMLSISDIFISTPTNEAIARSVLEAMSMELPVIATDVGGTSEAIVNGENGILVSVHGVAEIAEAMLRLGESKIERERMGIAARKVIIEKYEFGMAIQSFAMMHLGLKERIY